MTKHYRYNITSAQNLGQKTHIFLHVAILTLFNKIHATNNTEKTRNKRVIQTIYSYLIKQTKQNTDISQF